jgi:hypothetical protein
MRSWLVTALIFILLAATARRAIAQSIVLPKIDSINFFGEVGDFEGRDAVDAQTYGPFGAYGWGFETAFTMAAKDSYVVEMAIGYAQLFQHAKFSDGFSWKGEVRDLPSLSVYISFKNDLYVGIGTGIVSLANTTIDNGASRFAVTGDTFDAAAIVGYTIPLQSADSLADQHVKGFIETAYHARYFGGVNYGAGAPADLPGRVYLGGFTVLAGVQIAIGTKAAVADPAKISK